MKKIKIIKENRSEYTYEKENRSEYSYECDDWVVTIYTNSKTPTSCIREYAVLKFNEVGIECEF